MIVIEYAEHGQPVSDFNYGDWLDNINGISTMTTHLLFQQAFLFRLSDWLYAEVKLMVRK